MQLAWELVFFVISFVGVLCTVIGVPGNALPVLIAVGYWLLEGAPRFSGPVVLAFVIVFALGELAEQLAGTLGAKKYGGTKSGMWGAFLGSIAGGLLGTTLLPLVGTIAGVFVGCFALTLAFEIVFSKQKLKESVRAGWGAVVGKAAGVAFKYGVGFTLLCLLAWRFWLT